MAVNLSVRHAFVGISRQVAVLSWYDAHHFQNDLFREVADVLDLVKKMCSACVVSYFLISFNYPQLRAITEPYLLSTAWAGGAKEVSGAT